MSDTSKTPRTDAVSMSDSYAYLYHPGTRVVSVKFARILENELAIAKTEIEQLKTVCANYRKEAEIAVAEADELRKLVRFAIASNQDALNKMESIRADLEKKE